MLIIRAWIMVRKRPIEETRWCLSSFSPPVIIPLFSSRMRPSACMERARAVSLCLPAGVTLSVASGFASPRKFNAVASLSAL
jgi:hypothetical protein